MIASRLIIASIRRGGDLWVVFRDGIGMVSE